MEYRCPKCGKIAVNEEVWFVPEDGLMRCERCHWTGRKRELITPPPITPGLTLHCPECSAEWVVSGIAKLSDRAACACGWKGYVSNLKYKTRECPYGDAECGCRNGLFPTKTHLERKRNLYAANYDGTAPKPNNIQPPPKTNPKPDYYPPFYDMNYPFGPAYTSAAYSTSVDPAYAKRENEKMWVAIEEMFRHSPVKLEETMNESDTITYMQHDDGSMITCGTCTTGNGIEEYCGLCQQCWLNLEPAERAILQGKEPPVKEVVNTTNVIHRLNAPSKFLRTLDVAWRGGMTGALAALAWHVFHHLVK